MKRILLGVLLLATCATVNVLNLNSAHADVQDFVISDFKADYYLSRNSENRSTLKTVESITAVFPNYDQNHGIERALPKSYDGHSVSLAVQSVTDENGVGHNYTEYDSNGNQVIRIGDADKYVHGVKTYIITYSQQDVTKYFSDTNDDEFYWDVNGVGWTQPFSKVSATVHIDASIADKVSDKRSCYYGFSGETTTCSISINDKKDLITATVGNLSVGQTMTIAIGFKPHTFSPYKMSKQAALFRILSVYLVIICFIIMLVILYLRIVLYRDSPRTKAVIAQYVPPVGVELSTSSAILGLPHKVFPAAIISMAVKHNIQITEKVTNLLFGIKIKKYNLELLSTHSLTTTEREVAMILFGTGLNVSPGSSVDFPKTDAILTALLTGYIKSVKSQIEKAYLLPKKTRVAVAIALLSVIIMLGSFFSALSVWENTHNTLLVVGLITNVIICIFVFVTLPSRGPVNEKGRELYDYLQGMKLFIKTVEQDRIKMLQSPTGAERVSIDVNDKKAVIKLYEKLLPYAIIFGLEKEWSKVLAVQYADQNSSPVWYVGAAGFSASSFSSSLSSFSSSLGSSSSSGGSGGGGSSGGGGGGGGGGGW